MGGEGVGERGKERVEKGEREVRGREVRERGGANERD